MAPTLMPPFRGSTSNSEADRPSRSCLHQEAAIIAFEVARSTPWGSAARSGIWNHGSCMACKCPVNYMTHGATPEKERSLHTHLHASFAWRWEMGGFGGGYPAGYHIPALPAQRTQTAGEQGMDVLSVPRVCHERIPLHWALGR